MTRPTKSGPASAPAPEKPSQGKSRSLVWLLILCVLVFVGLAALLYHRPAATDSQPRKGRAGLAPPAVQVGTTSVRKGDVGIYVNTLGFVTPVNTVMVKSRVDGQLMDVSYVEGQMVHVGDPLVEIDPRPYEAQLAEAKGELARDQALLENARVDLDRYQTAYSKNAIPKQQLDTQVATVHQYEGTVEFDQGQVDNAKVQVIYSHITSPISGRVGLRLVDRGNIVHATDSNPLAVITQLQPITVVFSVAEDYLPQIQQQLRQGQILTVEAFDRAQQKKLADGTLLTLDNQIDTNTGTVKLKALFTNEDVSLFPNQFVNARLLVKTDHDATLVPTYVVQRNAQGAFVYVVQADETVAMRPITLGTSDGTVTAVQGVQPGETLAADNFNRLLDGVKVTVRKPEEGPGRHGGKKSDLAASADSGS